MGANTTGTDEVAKCSFLLLLEKFRCAMDTGFAGRSLRNAEKFMADFYREVKSIQRRTNWTELRDRINNKLEWDERKSKEDKIQNYQCWTRC